MSLPRCGSTTLMDVLNCHPDIRCLREPFNPDQAGNAYLGRVHDFGSLGSVLDHIWREFNGVKHVWEPCGWPFGRGMDFNLRLALQPDVRIVLLTRANHLQRIVSYEVAAQTNVWHRVQGKPRGSQKNGAPDKLRPLDPARLRRNMRLAMAGNELMRSTLRSSRTPFREVTYEEIYAPAASLRRVNEILGFLGASSLPDGIPLDRARRLLDPRSTKLNSEQTYHLVPNIDDIDELCGTDETGYLFAKEKAACDSLSSRSRAAAVPR
ncbi:MAG TPA: hypothetical protein VFB06_14485 [Streptosporangiaceae bacterium]|nr:hypothetical protein [Streptosporangiaceae bacterium]